jgi:hypothetical protein
MITRLWCRVPEVTMNNLRTGGVVAEVQVEEGPEYTANQALDGAPINLVFRCNRGLARIRDISLLQDDLCDFEKMSVLFNDKLSVR